MGYRILADENVEQATINYLRKLGHDVERIGDVEELGLADDESIAAHERETQAVSGLTPSGRLMNSPTSFMTSSRSCSTSRISRGWS